MGGNMAPGGKFDSFEHDFLMPPDIASIDSDINKISALTPFSDQYMPAVGQADQLGMSGYSPSQMQQSSYRRHQQQQQQHQQQ